jgi:hypothetical protein
MEDFPFRIFQLLIYSIKILFKSPHNQVHRHHIRKEEKCLMIFKLCFEFYWEKDSIRCKVLANQQYNFDSFIYLQFRIGNISLAKMWG